MAWPTQVSTTSLDSSSDLLDDARPQVEATANAVNDIIGSRDSASGIPSLDASALVTETQLRQLRTPVVKTANYDTVAEDNGRVFICEGSISFTIKDSISVVGTNHVIKNGNLGVSDSVVSVSVTGNTIEGQSLTELRPGDAITVVKGTTNWEALQHFRSDQITGTGFYPRNFGYFNEQIFEDGSLWATLSTDVTEATWESVGPTSSGADNIWTALDDVPSLRGFVVLNASVSCDATSAGQVSAFVSVRQYQSIWTATDREIAITKGYAEAAGATVLQSRGSRIVPIDSNRRFEIYWDGDANNDTTSIRLTLDGFWN